MAKAKKVEEDVVVLKHSEYDKNARILKSYSFAYNSERKAYDMMIVSIDLPTLEMTLEIEKLRVDSEARAMLELQKRYSEDLMKRVRRK
jgi:hypothetical protein